MNRTNITHVESGAVLHSVQSQNNKPTIKEVIYYAIKESKDKAHFFTDFSNCNFEGTEIEGVSFLYCDLQSASFKNANLKYAKFYGTIQDVNFEGANMESAFLQNVYSFENCNFKGANLKEAIFNRALLLNCQFDPITKYEYDHLVDMLQHQGIINMEVFFTSGIFDGVNTLKELYECGTQFCCAGLLYAKELIKNKDKVVKVLTATKNYRLEPAEIAAWHFAPNLAYMFRMTKLGFIIEAKRRIKEYELAATKGN